MNKCYVYGNINCSPFSLLYFVLSKPTKGHSGDKKYVIILVLLYHKTHCLLENIHPSNQAGVFKMGNFQAGNKDLRNWLAHLLIWTHSWHFPKGNRSEASSLNSYYCYQYYCCGLISIFLCRKFIVINSIIWTKDRK